ncbi:restriction endonuclease subunit S [Moraxella sp. Pampa]|uniref:restriction endonuclease subunit S n=1 Tax=Moraxella sp. Pampa TaxID=3111978 RepID=UPI002B405970|nr:restriction endonuclease subunit S [Moraxella sp. Pampa]
MMNKLKLTDREWGEFFIGDIFSIKIGKSIDGNKVDRVNGQFAYITRKENTNGLDGFIDYDISYLNKDFPVITIGNETAEPFVQEFPFFTGTKVNILKPKEQLNRYVLFFICSSLKMHKTKYSYSFTINSTRLKKQNILLPINNQGNPDWQFMEDYIKQIEQKQKTDLINYYSNKLLEIISDTNYQDVQWDIFKISDFFNFMRGNQNNMAKCEKGDIPLISARKVDNGYKDFIADNGKRLFPAHIITLNNDGDGGVGLAYYQSTQTALDTHVTALLPKINLTKSAMLYICLMISIQRDKFSHGYSINNERLSAQKIMLPIDNNSNPNWQFMEDFIKNIEKDKIETLLSYLNQYNILAEPSRAEPSRAEPSRAEPSRNIMGDI